MSDAMGAVAEAMALTKRLAASSLVKKQGLEAELAELQRRRARVDDGAAAGELDAAIQAVTGELAVADASYRSALKEIDELKKLAGKARIADAGAGAGSLAPADPLIRSLEEQALDNARGHLAELEAQLRLEEELGGTAARPPTREDSDAQARSEFEARRARLEQPGGSDDDAPKPPRKKTL